MALIGLVRVTDVDRESEVQHKLLDPVCSKVLREDATRRRVIENRPGLLTALEEVGDDDHLVVTKVRFLAQNMITGLEVLVALVDQGVAVRVLLGAAAGEHEGSSFFLDQSRKIVEFRRNIRSEKINAGLSAARVPGSHAGRPTVVDDTRWEDIVMRREQGESIRSIAQAVDVSVGTVYNNLSRAQTSLITPPP